MSETPENPSSYPPPAPQGSGAPEAYGAPPNLPAPPPPAMVPMTQAQSAANGLYVAAAVINWVVLGLIIVGTLGIGIVAAAWFIPMTIRIHKGARDTSKHTALAVCTLLFCNLISGILLLVDEGNRQATPSY